MIRRRPELIIALLALCAASPASAGDLRYSFALGFGGTGISREVNTAFGPTKASKSEGPGVAAIAVDYPLTDNFSIGAEHSRGFRLGPFSAGVSFTGVLGRWYFMGPQAIITSQIPTHSSLFVRRVSPFLGVTMGIATGKINREDEIVQDINDSGAYFGYRLGADYAIDWRMALRPEMVYSTTFSGEGKVVEFAVQCGIVFSL